MKLREYLNLYQVECTTDPATGKKKKISKYVGKYYVIDESLLKKTRAKSLASLIAGWVFFLLCGLTSSPMSGWVWTQLAFMLTLLPLFYFTLSFLRLARLKNPFTEDCRRDCFQSGTSAGIALAVCGTLWFIASIVFLAKFSHGKISVMEILFITGSLCETAAGIIQYTCVSSAGEYVRAK